MSSAFRVTQLGSVRPAGIRTRSTARTWPMCNARTATAPGVCTSKIPRKIHWVAPWGRTSVAGAITASTIPHTTSGRNPGHAQSLTAIQESDQGADSCLPCHSAEGVLASGSNAVVTLQQNAVVAENPVTCASCHDPHGGANDSQLRDAAADLCIQCHTISGSEPGSTPHNPQREILLGVGGQNGDGSAAEGPNSAHSTIIYARCVTCHVFQEYPEDPTKENPVNTGHTFRANVDASCNIEGCHSTPEGAQAVLASTQAEINGKVAELEAYFTPGDAKFIELEGLSDADEARFDIAKFNVQLVAADSSGGIHNAAYVRRLLDIAETIFIGLPG